MISGSALNITRAAIAQINLSPGVITPVVSFRTGREQLLVRTISTAPVWLGGAAVSASNGFPLMSPDGKTADAVDVKLADAVFAVCAVAATIYVFEAFHP